MLRTDEQIVVEMVVNDLVAENIKTMDVNARLRADNAKLRKLVRVMYYCNQPLDKCCNCYNCELNNADMRAKISGVEFCDAMYDCLRELGIEVGE